MATLSNHAPPKPGTARRIPPVVYVGVAVVALGFFLPKLLTGATASTPVVDDTPAAALPSLSGLLVRLLFGFVVVTGGCVLVAKWMNRRAAPLVPGLVSVIAAVPVDTRCHVYLVNAGGRRLLVGVDPAGVKSMVELTGDIPAIA